MHGPERAGIGARSPGQRQVTLATLKKDWAAFLSEWDIFQIAMQASMEQVGARRIIKLDLRFK